MNQSLAKALASVIDLLEPHHVVVVGARDGEGVQTLLAAAAEAGATVHIVDRRPNFDLALARQTAGDFLMLHRAPLPDVLPLIPLPDLVIVDEDPNWHAVFSALDALDRRAEQLGRAFPLTAIHNAGWPFGRRDSYDDPDAIPAPLRQPHERAGIVPGATALAASAGLFSERFNASAENEPKSGVRTAIEDFVIAGQRCGFSVLPMFHGLAIVHPLGLAAASLEPVLAAFSLGPAAAFLADEVEAARVAAEVELAALRRKLEQARVRNALLDKALRAEQTAHAVLRWERREYAVPMAVEQAARDRHEDDLGDSVGQPTDAGEGAETAEAVDDERAAREVALLRGSSIFNPAWYRGAYGHLIGDLDPARHYLEHGLELELDPGPAFSARFYLAENPDVRDAGYNPLLHYLLFGAKEGRDPSPFFQSRFYLECNSDVSENGMNPLEHYLKFGRTEGRVCIEPI